MISVFKIITLFNLAVLIISLVMLLQTDLIKTTLYSRNLKSELNEILVENKTDVMNDEGTLSNIGWNKTTDLLHFDPKMIKPSTIMPQFQSADEPSTSHEILLENKTDVMNDEGTLSNIGWNKTTDDFLYFDPKMIKPSARLLQFQSAAEPSTSHEILLENKTDVLNNEGKLSNIGWCRTTDLLHFDPKMIKPSTSFFSVLDRFRYKKWEAFLFVHKDFILGTAVFDLSYIGGYLLHFGNLTDGNKEIIGYEHMNPFVKPSIEDNCLTNCKAAQYNRTEFSYLQTKDSSNGDQHLDLSYNNENLNIELHLRLKAKDYDSIVTLTPISNDTTLFYYNAKTYTIPVTGDIKVNGQNFEAKDMLMTYDSGRGVWPLHSGWFWASANGLTTINQDKIGLNFGHGFSHPNASRHTEDSFFINGKMFKLGAVETRQIVNMSDEGALLEYQFKTKHAEGIINKCDVSFTPLKQRDSRLNFGFANTVFVVTYGLFKGKCHDENGNLYEFDHVYGMVEDKKSFW